MKIKNRGKKGRRNLSGEEVDLLVGFGLAAVNILRGLLFAHGR
jgi:hypothetical protein